MYQDGGTYLITGGFSGIGLTLAEDMIRTHHANIVLIARTPLPERSEWEKYISSHSPNDTTAKRIEAVQKLEALGGKVMVAAADVCNLVDMSTIVDEAKSQFGTINGVIHAAGVVDDAPLLTKNSASIEDVLAPKIHGTQVLHKLFADGTLDWLVLFSSTSTIIAPAGQVDYLAANEYLNAYAKSRKGDRTKVIAINWGIWNEVGMAAQAISDRMGEQDPIPSQKIDAPLLDEATFDAAGNRIFTAAYKTRERWFLDEHRTKAGNALLPGTGYLELAMQALRANGETAAVEIRDMLFLRPLQVGDTETRDVQVALNRTSAGYDLEVRSNCMLNGRNGFQLNAQANLAMIRKPDLSFIDVSEIFARCADVETAVKETETLRSPQENHLSFGSRWRVLKNMAYGAGEGIAELRLPNQYRSDIQDGYLLHPALLDLATGWAMKLMALLRFVE